MLIWSRPQLKLAKTLGIFSRSMKIALYVPSWPPGETASGIVTYASHLVPALLTLGHEVFKLTFHKDRDDLDPHTIDLYRFATKQRLWDRAFYQS